MTGYPTACLSPGQEFLCSLDQGDTAGALSQWYTVTYGLRVTGEIDTGALEAALGDVVARHEVLRTCLVRELGRSYQEIHPPGTVALRVTDLPGVPARSRKLRAEELLNEAESLPFSVRDLPLLRAVLGRFGAGDSVLALTAHHLASDAWSMELIINDLAACYAARRSGAEPALPPVAQYRDLAGWQQAQAGSAAAVARQYWRGKLDGGRMFAVPADRVPVPGAPDPYSVYRFAIDADLAAATAVLAKSTRCSLFITLLAAYNLLACRLTGGTDLVVPTFSSGRGEPRFRDTVGPCYNFLPIRTDLAGCTSFLDVVARTRASCLEAYTHDVPFTHIEAQAGELMRSCGGADHAVAAFEMLPPAEPSADRQAGDTSWAQIRDRRLSQPVGASTPRGLLWALDRLPSGELVGTLRFGRDRFDESTVPALVSQYREVLRKSVADPAAHIRLP